MPLSVLETELRQLARDKIMRSSLPCAERSKVWGGRGAGALCALCEKPITAEEVAYEVSISQTELQFHIFCHRDWQLECGRLLWLKRRTDPSSACATRRAVQCPVTAIGRGQEPPQL